MAAESRSMNLWIIIHKDGLIRFSRIVPKHTVGSAQSNQIRVTDPEFPALHGQFVEEREDLLYCDFDRRTKIKVFSGYSANWCELSVWISDIDSYIADHKDIILCELRTLLRKSQTIETILSWVKSDWMSDTELPEELEGFIRAHLKELECESPIETLLEDPEVTDILVEGYDQIWVERSGALSLAAHKFTSPSSYAIYIENILTQAHKSIDESSPFVDFMLSGGARAHVIGPPTTLGEYYLSIRKIRSKTWSLDELCARQMISQNFLLEMRRAIFNRQNILVSGATGSGKTTLLKAIMNEIPAEERLIVIEDSVELKMKRSNASFMYTRQDSRGLFPPITIRDLVKQSLRMRPDRIIIGEVRGEEAMDLLHAMNTGHRGCFASIHANSTRDALSRLQGLVRMSSASLSETLVQEWIGKNIHFLIHCGRSLSGERRVIESAWVRGLDGSRVLLEVNGHGS